MESQSLANPRVKQREKEIVCCSLSVFQVLVLASAGPKPSHVFFPLVSGNSPIFLASVHPFCLVCVQKEPLRKTPGRVMAGPSPDFGAMLGWEAAPRLA